jgi:hypothetical protein
MSSERFETEEEKRKKADQASRAVYLTSLISSLKARLLSLSSRESASLTRSIDEKELRLRSVAADGSDFSSSQLSSLEQEIKEITEKADQESRRLALLGEISKVMTQLAPLQGHDSASILRKITEKKLRLEAARPDNLSATELSASEDDIAELNRRTQQEFRKSILLEEISNIRSNLASLQNPEASALLKNLDEQKVRLGLVQSDGMEFSSYEISSLQSNIDKIKEKADSLMSKQGGQKNTGESGSLINALSKIPIAIWVAVIPVVGSIYLGILSYRQSQDNIQIPLQATQTAADAQTAAAKPITQTAEAKETIAALESSARQSTVSFINPQTNPGSVELIIKDGQQAIVEQMTIRPGEIHTVPDLEPGNYYVEAQLVSALITPQSPDCRIEWRPNDSYKGELLITSDTTVFQVMQFNLTPQEICVTDTPAPPSSTPN